MSNTDEGVNYEKIKRIRLISNCFGYGPWPEPATEVEQHLTITSDGRIWFSKYCFNDGVRYKCTCLERLHITSDAVGPLVNQLAEFFNDMQDTPISFEIIFGVCLLAQDTVWITSK